MELRLSSSQATRRCGPTRFVRSYTLTAKKTRDLVPLLSFKTRLVRLPAMCHRTVERSPGERQGKDICTHVHPRNAPPTHRARESSLRGGEEKR